MYFFFRFVPKAPFIFFKEVTDSVIEQRKNANVKPNDMLQMFLDIKEKGSTKEDSNENNITDQFEKDAELKGAPGSLLRSQASLMLVLNSPLVVLEVACL